ncbi:MAG: hypothetical protein ACTSPI_17520, partial [Candidatus Heimdallarchaeaceae archaeon]
MYSVPFKTKKFHRNNPFDDPNKDIALIESYKVLDSIFPKPAYIRFLKKNAKKTVKEKNQWSITYILVVGAEETGKSETIDFICDFFRDTFPAEESFTEVTSTELESLYQKIPKGKRYILLCAEDVTSALTKQYKDIKINIKKRRWICRNKTGFNEGILIQVLGVHRYFSIPELFRDDIDLTIVKSIPSDANVFDNIHQISKLVSSPGAKFLNECDEKRTQIKSKDKLYKVSRAFKKFAHYFGFGTYKVESTKKIGLWYNPIVDKIDLWDLEYLRRGDNEGVPQIDHKWTTIDVFDWQDKIYEELLIHSKYSDYAKFWKVLVMEDEPATSPETWKKLNCGRTKTFEMRRDLIKDKNSSVFGYINALRGEKLFEQFVLNACEDLAIPHRHKPTHTLGTITYEDDLLLGENILINLKVGEGMNSYTWEDHYKTTYIFSQNGFETFVLYYDLTRNL